MECTTYQRTNEKQMFPLRHLKNNYTIDLNNLVKFLGIFYALSMFSP